jgi:lipopolysaccharide biosynthesis regulator YciM
MTPTLQRLLDVGRQLGQWLQGTRPAPPGGADDPKTIETMTRAREARERGHADEARTLYRYVLQRWPHHADALRGLRDLAIDARDWDEAVAIQQRLLTVAPPADRAVESEWLAVGYYELGRLELARNDAGEAAAHFRAALRADREFLPATLALGDALEAAGDHREAVRVWERAAETRPSLPLLARLERTYRREDRPSRMIALYRTACDRAPDDLGLAAALGRVYFELEMLDEAADQFEKLEVRAPDLPVVHAYLGAVFERRGQSRDAFEEYRRALRLGRLFDWPHRCEACSADVATWQDRCPRCQRWNTLKPAQTR